MQEKNAKVLAVRVVTLLYDLVTEKVSARTCSAFPSFCFVFTSGHLNKVPSPMLLSVQHLGQNGRMDGQTDGWIAKMSIKEDVI